MALSDSSASLAEQNLRSRCWFIFARGAQPSRAKYTSLVGRTAATNRSKYFPTFCNISCSFLGWGVPSSGWQQGCTTPLQSINKLSTCTHRAKSPLVSLTNHAFVLRSNSPRSRPSSKSSMTHGYLFASQRKKAGTPMVQLLVGRAGARRGQCSEVSGLGSLCRGYVARRRRMALSHAG